MATSSSSSADHQHGLPTKAAPHILVLHYPGQGHANPFIAIAHYLAATGISVTLVQPGDGLQHTAAAGTSPLRHEVIPTGFDLLDHPLSVAGMLGANEVMRKALTKLLQKLMMEENAPSCMLIDAFFEWGDAVAAEFSLSRVVLWPSSAAMICLGLHISDMVERGFIPATEQGAMDKIVDFIPGLSPFRIGDLPKDLTAEEGLQGTAFTFFRDVFQKLILADRILINTVYELETAAIDALRKEDHMHVHIDSIGPLHCMTSMEARSSVRFIPEDTSCLSWLNQQQQSSVLYIAFGSIASLEENAFAELAHGLEASGEKFLWVIRPDTYKSKASVEEILPEGFLERTHNQGLVISWAPQLAVLGHSSVGAFLTHCGWNSVLESLSNGVPLLGFPQMAEQKMNLRFIVEDWKVGLPLVQEQKVKRTGVQNAVTALIRGDEGLHARIQARKWKEVAQRAIQYGSSKDSLQKLVNDLKHGLLKKSVKD